MSHALNERRIWFEINTPLGCGHYTEDDLRRAYDLGFKAGEKETLTQYNLYPLETHVTHD